MDTIYSKIKHKAIAVYIIGGMFALLFGFILLYYSNSEFFKYFFAKAPDLFQASSSEYKDSDWFSCNNNLLYGCFAENKHGKYYITSTNEGEYFGFYVYKSETELADSISEDTFDLLDGKTDEQSKNYLSGKGYFVDMDVSEEKYFNDYFNYGDNSASDYKLIYKVFYLTKPTNLIFSGHNGSDITMFILGACLFVGGIASIISFIAGGYKKGLKKSMLQYGILDEVLERDMQNFTSLYDKAFFGQEHILLVSHVGHVIPYDQLVWAYYKVTNTKHTVYGVIPAGTTTSYQLVFYNRRHVNYEYQVNDELEAKDILEKLKSYAPYVLIGYSEEIANLANNGQYRQLINAVDEQKRKVENENNSTDSDFYNQNNTQKGVMTYEGNI